MTFEGVEKVIAAIGSALAAILTPVGVMYAASLNRANKAAEASVAGLQAENERLRKEVEEERELAEYERRSGVRWFEIARYFYNEAHEMAGEARGARQVAESIARTARVELAPWSRRDLTLPRLEDPVPPPPRPKT